VAYQKALGLEGATTPPKCAASWPSCAPAPDSRLKYPALAFVAAVLVTACASAPPAAPALLPALLP
jgi:hypothetical protein